MQDSTTTEPVASATDTKAVAKFETKQVWSAPSLQTLDFLQTQGGTGPFSEGAVGGLPSGSMS